MRLNETDTERRLRGVVPDELASTQEVRDRLAAIVESSDDAIIGEALDGTITSWNRGAERIFGYTAEEVLGRPIEILALPGHEDDHRRVLSRVAQGERVDHYETLRRSRDGRPVTVSLSVSPIRDSSGTVVGASKVARDITATRDAEEVRALLAAIVDSSDDAIVSKTLDGIVTTWNKGAERLFGYSAEEMIGQPITRIACHGREDDLLRVLDSIRAGRRVDHYETTRRRKDGREITVSLTVSPIRDGSGRIIGASKVARDITGRKQSEAALRTAEQLALVGRMAASIAHEINNPLEAVMNLLYLMQNQELDEQARQYLAMAQHELGRVAHITVQTLGFYRPSTDPARAIVAEVVDAALSLHRGRIKTSGIEVQRKYREVPPVPCSEGDLRQVFANLIGNALDAMQRGGRLRVNIRRGTDWSTGRKGVRVTVADTGSGMSRNTRANIFEPFFTTKGATGTGLGLWITADIVARHAGLISVRSSEGTDARPRHGSVFAVFLPFPEAAAVGQNGEPLPPQS